MSIWRTNWFWLVSLKLILFLYFLKFLLKIVSPQASQGKKIVFFGLTAQKLWVFKILGEVWVGRACVGANEENLTKHQKFLGQKSRSLEKWRIHGGMVSGCRLLVDPPLGDRWSAAAAPVATTSCLLVCSCNMSIQIGCALWLQLGFFLFFVTIIFAISPTFL